MCARNSTFLNDINAGILQIYTAVLSVKFKCNTKYTQKNKLQNK